MFAGWCLFQNVIGDLSLVAWMPDADTQPQKIPTTPRNHVAQPVVPSVPASLFLFADPPMGPLLSAALGIALGLGELSGPIDPASICTNPDLYTNRGGSSSGIELMRCQVLVVGNVEGAASNYVSGHHILADLIDADGVRAALRSVGITVEGTVSKDQRDRIVNVFGKGQVSLDGRVRGNRSTLLTDSDLNTRPARAVLGAVIASVVGDPAIYASAGWGYHQGPAGGGMVAVIAKA